MINPFQLLLAVTAILVGSTGCNRNSNPPQTPNSSNWGSYETAPSRAWVPSPASQDDSATPRDDAEPADVPQEAPRIAGPATVDASKMDVLIDCATRIGGERLCGAIVSAVWPPGAIASGGVCNALHEYYNNGTISWDQVVAELGLGYGFAKLGKLGGFLDKAKMIYDFGSCLDDGGVFGFNSLNAQSERLASVAVQTRAVSSMSQNHLRNR